MTFFEHQARARRKTAWLVFLFALAVLGVTLAVNLVVMLLDRGIVGRFPFVVIDARGDLAIAGARVPLGVYVAVSLATLAMIAVRSGVAMARLRTGGDVVARMAGGVPVDHGTAGAEERRLLNVVEEMAIASGVTIPRVYVLLGEDSINAFAAGYAPNQAAIAVTEGALRRLTRDELQGVVAHEFSHILNGDMRLNVQMIGVLAGILFVGELGGALLRGAGSARRSSRDRGGSGVVLIGLILTVVGYAGLFFGRLIKAAVSREREFLGDASAVQFTRNPDGLAHALAKIAALPQGSLVRARHAESLSHMFFAAGVDMWLAPLFATHPPIAERLRRLDPRLAAEYAGGERRPERGPAIGRPAAAASRLATPAGEALARGVPGPPSPAAGRAGAAPHGVPVGGPASASAVVASVGHPTPRHVAYAATVLDTLPAAVVDALGSVEGAEAVILAFALDPDPVARKRQLALLDAAGIEARARRTERLADAVHALPVSHRLPVVSLALPVLRGLGQDARARLVESVRALVAADARTTLEEFVLLTLVSHHLAPEAGGPVPIRYRSILEVVEPARRVVSLLASAGGGDSARAAARGRAALQLTGDAPTAEDLDFGRIAGALGELRGLAPFVKRNFLAACVETVTTDGRITLTEAELVRAVAIVLDCPVPPILEGTVS